MKRRFNIAISIAMLGALVFVSPAVAQRGVGAKPGPVGRAAGGSFGMRGRSAFHPAPTFRPIFRGRGSGWGIGPGWGWAYLPYPDYYVYPDYEPVGGEAPPLVMMEAPRPVRVIEPILLERQGDQWVRITGYSESPAPAQVEVPQTVGAIHLRAATPSANEPPREVPPAVLVFRDGHEEEVKSYTIIGDTLYAKANYWINGTWTKKIEISNLDVPATLELNQERGSNFRLPSGPQEVMIRP